MTSPATVSAAALDTAVARLRRASQDRRPCAPVRDVLGTDPNLAYAVQRRMIEDRLRSGRRVVGHKIGLTSPAVQAQLGVDQPDFGVLLDDMACEPGEPVAIERLLQPRIEAEVAFVLAADITDPDVDAASVRAAVEYAVAALEIVDSRIQDWDITLCDTVADNASSGLFVLGSAQVSLADVEPLEVEMAMSIDDEVVSTGSGRACLGDPLAALAWLGRTAVAHGDPLRAGHIVLSGALGPMRAVEPGVRVHAQISGLGSVEIRFDEGGS